MENNTVGATGPVRETGTIITLILFCDYTLQAVETVERLLIHWWINSALHMPTEHTHMVHTH